MVEQEVKTQKVQEVGCNQVKEVNVEQEDFLTHLKAYGGEWFWNDIQTSNRTE